MGQMEAVGWRDGFGGGASKDLGHAAGPHGRFDQHHVDDVDPALEDGMERGMRRGANHSAHMAACPCHRLSSLPVSRSGQLRRAIAGASPFLPQRTVSWSPHTHAPAARALTPAVRDTPHQQNRAAQIARGVGVG